MKIKTQNKDAKNIMLFSMKKIIFLMLLIALVACNVSAANLYNYVYNGTSWVPMISTDDGQQKLWIEMKNCSYGSVQNNLYVNGNIGIGTTSLTPLANNLKPPITATTITNHSIQRHKHPPDPASNIRQQPLNSQTPA